MVVLSWIIVGIMVGRIFYIIFINWLIIRLCFLRKSLFDFLMFVWLFKYSKSVIYNFCCNNFMVVYSFLLGIMVVFKDLEIFLILFLLN